MSRTRTFLAVEIDDGIRTRAVALQQALATTGAGVKWVEPGNLHVTLLFLGEIDDRELHAVCRAVAGVAAGEPAFGLRVAGVGAFPTARRPKTVWAGVTDGAADLDRLHAGLEAALVALGCYRKEARPYTPHLTLGRVKGEADGDLLAPALATHRAWDGGATAVAEVVVFGSELRRDGPEYTPIGRARLASAAGR